MAPFSSSNADTALHPGSLPASASAPGRQAYDRAGTSGRPYSAPVIINYTQNIAFNLFRAGLPGAGTPSRIGRLAVPARVVLQNGWRTRLEGVAAVELERLIAAVVVLAAKGGEGLDRRGRQENSSSVRWEHPRTSANISLTVRRNPAQRLSRPAADTAGPMVSQAPG